MHLIDTHTHIYLTEFTEDRPEVMKRAMEAGVRAFYLPAIDSSTHEVMLSVEKEYEGCEAMMGLHPCSVNQDVEKELQLVRDHLQKRRFIAIGETGLDFYWDKTFVELQYQAFEEQIRLAMEHDLPVVIHSRNAIDECIEVVQKFPGSRGVFHCFSGNEEQAAKIISMNYMMGIGGVVSFKNSGLDKVIERTGLDHVILETDAPYLAPVPFRGKRNEPSYLKLVVEKLSAITGKPVDTVAELTTENALRLFKMKR